jgi:hypothetical protein
MIEPKWTEEMHAAAKVYKGSGGFMLDLHGIQYTADPQHRVLETIMRFGENVSILICMVISLYMIISRLNAVESFENERQRINGVTFLSFRKRVQ